MIFFSAHLHSKDELIRSEAAVCIENLSRQCSDWMSIKEMIERLFAVLNGNLVVLEMDELSFSEGYNEFLKFRL
jgi:hypothetical protein